MKLSEKQKTELYAIVHEAIMQTRIKIWEKRHSKVSISEIDDLMSDLCVNAPQKAIDFFKS